MMKRKSAILQSLFICIYICSEKVMINLHNIYSVQLDLRAYPFRGIDQSRRKAMKKKKTKSYIDRIAADRCFVSPKLIKSPAMAAAVKGQAF